MRMHSGLRRPSLPGDAALPRRALSLLFCLLAVCAARPRPARAQRSGRRREKLKGVGVTQKLGTTLPTALSFRTETGESVPLGQYFDGSTPVILTLNYHRCPQLCRVQLRKFARTVSNMAWTPGEQFEILTVDINPDEGPRMARTAQRRYRAPFDDPDAALDGWHFLTGTAEAIDVLTDSVGFHYDRLESRTQQFAHPTALIFLSGSGTVTRYFTTLSPAPGDVRTALVEASNGEVGSVVDRVFLACCQFNPDTNSYSASAFRLMTYGCLLLAVLMGAALFVFWRRETRRQDEAVGPEGLRLPRD